MTCKDCIHYEICTPYVSPSESFPEVGGCKCFKDKSRYIELPCRVGSKIYMLVTKRSKVGLPPFTFIKVSRMTFYNLERVIQDFGKTVFLTREEAEKAFAERRADNDNN